MSITSRDSSLPIRSSLSKTATRSIVVANSLEEGRVRKQSRATSVFNIDAFGAKDLAGKGISREELDANVIARFLASRDTKLVSVAWYFPVGMAERLRAPWHRRRTSCTTSPSAVARRGRTRSRLSTRPNVRPRMPGPGASRR